MMNNAEANQLWAYLDDARTHLRLMATAGADTTYVERLVGEAIKLVSQHLRGETP